MLDKTFENVLFEEKDGVGYITLNNPAQMNAVTAEVTRDLITCIEYCEQEPALRCVVLRGAGGNFCAGGNVKAMKERLDKGINGAKAGIRIGGEWIMRLKTISKPTIAWIEGAAAGVGCSMAMACDFSIAAEDCKFVIAFVNIGYVPDGGFVGFVAYVRFFRRQIRHRDGGRKPGLRDQDARRDRAAAGSG